MARQSGKHIPMIDLTDKTIAVLKGGPGSERAVSLKTAESVAEALRSIGAKVVEVDVAGADFSVPADTFIAMNLIHGTFGEDGQLQALLEQRGIRKCCQLAGIYLHGRENRCANAAWPCWPASIWLM